MKYLYLDELCGGLNCQCIHGEPMSKHTTFKVGGKADIFLKVGDVDSLSKVMSAIYQHKTPYYILGNGSDVIVRDEGYRGVIITLTDEFKKISLTGDRIITCGAGASMASVCTFAREHSLTGLEFAWGIPGGAGGAAYMNAGAYGGEMKDVLHSCTHVTEKGEIGTLTGDELELSYRKSAYSGNKNVITGLTLILEKGSQAEISAKMDDLMNRRKSKQPLEFPSAGSTFKRPEGYFAAALIDECGLKGKKVGGAEVSEKHAGFVINSGSATCNDILELIELIKGTVKSEKGVDLECEVKVI